MITGYIHDDIPKWYPKALQELLETFKNTDFETIETGKHNVKGDDVFFMVDDYTTRSASEARPEDHKIYVDVQLICKGEENFGVTLGTEGLTEDTAYDEQKDIRFFKPTDKYDQLHFKKDMYLILWPADVHVPGLNRPDGSRHIRKIVGKIKLSLLQE